MVGAVLSFCKKKSASTSGTCSPPLSLSSVPGWVTPKSGAGAIESTVSLSPPPPQPANASAQVKEVS